MTEDKKGTHYIHYKVADFLPHIADSGGIITTIARRVGCAWNTARKHIDASATLRRAYQDELEKSLDVAESILFDNLRLARRTQISNEEVVDSGDARWFLGTKGKGRGYSERQEVTGADGGPIQIDQTFERALERAYGDDIDGDPIS